MTSEQFAIRTIEELAAATYSVTVRGTNRYIFGGGNKAGEFLTFSLSFEDFDRADGQLGRELTDTLQVGIVIVETDDDADAFHGACVAGGKEL